MSIDAVPPRSPVEQASADLKGFIRRLHGTSAEADALLRLLDVYVSAKIAEKVEDLAESGAGFRTD